MAALGSGEEASGARELPATRPGGVTVIGRADVLDDTVNELVSLGFHVARLDATTWQTRDAMFDDVAHALGFPDHFGRNLDALHDCLQDVAHGLYGWRPGATGLALVVTGLDTFAQRLPEAARALVDALTAIGRSAVDGRRVQVLIQTVAPDRRPERT